VSDRGILPSEDQFPATWFRTTRWSNDIKPVTVHKVTDHFVTFIRNGRQRREKRDGLYSSWEEAYAMLLARKKREIETAERLLAQAKRELDEILMLVKP
jgi:hypothetical protein